MSAIRFGRKALAGESKANARPGEVFVRAHTKTVRGTPVIVPAHFKRKARRSRRRRSGSRKRCKAHQRRSRKTGRCRNFRKKRSASRSRRRRRRSKCKVKSFSLSGKSWCPPGTPVKRGRCCVKHSRGKTGVVWPAEVTAAYQAKQRWEDAKWRAKTSSSGAKKNWAKAKNKLAATSRFNRAGVRGRRTRAQSVNNLGNINVAPATPNNPFDFTGFGFGSGNGNPRYPNLTSVMGNYRPAAQMDLYQQYTGMSGPQFAAHMSGVLPSDVSNFYSQ